MNNTNQQLYTIYANTQRFYQYRRLVSIDAELSQEDFIKRILKDKYLLLSAIDRTLVETVDGDIDQAKFGSIKKHISSHNEKSKTESFTLTHVLLVYPGTESESKRANMMKLINHVRYPKATIIIITPTKVTSGVAKGLQALTRDREHRFHEFKLYTYMLLNSIIPEYELAPKYSILTAEQIDELKAWFIDPDSLPKIFDTDPQMVWIGATVGDVVKYTYLSEVTIEGIGYCKVIPETQ